MLIGKRVPAGCTTKLFTIVINVAVQKASGFVAESHSHVSSIFANKGGAYILV
jgi:hypothetical protein